MMVLKAPDSMKDCLYFTNRLLNNEGSVLAWVYRKLCPKCKKTRMGKPAENGKIKTRSDEYVCANCGYSEKKEEHEESLMLEAQYTCPTCRKKGESVAPYKRKAVKGVQAYVVECQHCHNQIPITKKLKELK